MVQFVQAENADPEPGRIFNWRAPGHQRPPWMAPDDELTPNHHPLGEPQEIELDHFALSLDPVLDRAEGWDCPNGMYCTNRACVGKLHNTIDQARDYLLTHSLEWTKQVLNIRPRNLAARALTAEGPLPHFHLVHVEGVVVGYDYRASGCQIPNAFDQLWHQEGRGPAWRRVLAHRARYGAHAAALPGRTSGGFLFAFLTGCDDLEMTSVDRAPGRLPEDLELP